MCFSVSEVWIICWPKGRLPGLIQHWICSMKQAGNKKGSTFIFLSLIFLFVCITYQINFSAVLLEGGVGKQYNATSWDVESVIENGWKKTLLGVQFYWIVFRQVKNCKLLQIVWKKCPPQKLRIRNCKQAVSSPFSTAMLDEWLLDTAYVQMWLWFKARNKQTKYQRHKWYF